MKHSKFRSISLKNPEKCEISKSTKVQNLKKHKILKNTKNAFTEFSKKKNKKTHKFLKKTP